MSLSLMDNLPLRGLEPKEYCSIQNNFYSDSLWQTGRKLYFHINIVVLDHLAVLLNASHSALALGF